MSKDELIAALEKATGPAFVLDMEIAKAVNPNATKNTVPLPYSASIDAALTLVPEGWNWAVFGRLDWPNQNAQVWHPQREASTNNGDAPTPALALCIAALRAGGEG